MCCSRKSLLFLENQNTVPDRLRREYTVCVRNIAETVRKVLFLTIADSTFWRKGKAVPVISIYSTDAGI